MEGNQFVIVPKTIQKKQLHSWTQLFATPKWLMDQYLFKINPDNGVEAKRNAKINIE
jgi:hypothetical protein